MNTAPNISATLAKTLTQTLSERIIEGHYRPGDRLIESVIAGEFGVSHGPVREALRFLQNAGLVMIHTYRGASVTDLSTREVEEIFEVRSALVGLRAKWIAQSPQRTAFITQLEKVIKELIRLADSPNKSHEYATVAFELNRRFTQCVSNHWLRETIEALTLQTARYTRLGFSTPERRRQSARLWKALATAVKQGDAENAQRIACRLSLASRDGAIHALSQRAATRPSTKKAAQWASIE